MMAVKYIGKKPYRSDSVCGTGLVWTPGQVHVVTDDVGSRLIRHTDVWANVEITDAMADAAIPVAAPKKAAKKEEDEPRAELVNFGAMKLPALRDYARAHFNTTLPARITEETARRKVIELDKGHRLYHG